MACQKAQTPYFFLLTTSKPQLGFPWWLSGKESPANVGDPCSIPGLGSLPREGNGILPQYSCLGNPMEEELGGLRSMGSKKCQTRLSNGAHTQPQLRCLDTMCLTSKRNNVSREKVNWKTDCRKINLEKKVSGRDVIAVTRAPVLQIQHVVWVSSIENSQSLGVI